MGIIALYHNLIFQCWIPDNKLHQNGKIRSHFVETFEGSEQLFIKRYKNQWPNYSFQTFRGNKPLSKRARQSIEEIIKNDPKVRGLLRDYKLRNILGF